LNFSGEKFSISLVTLLINRTFSRREEISTTVGLVGLTDRRRIAGINPEEGIKSVFPSVRRGSPFWTGHLENRLGTMRKRL
jgi:hypothetical protein